MKHLLFILLALALLIPGCSGGFSKCDAVKIARSQIPAAYADAGAFAALDKTVGANGAWKISFMNLYVPFTDLNWPGTAGDYYVSLSLVRTMPLGVYANASIYVDAKTGAVVKKELDNGVFLGGASGYVKCDK